MKPSLLIHFLAPAALLMACGGPSPNRTKKIHPNTTTVAAQPTPTFDFDDRPGVVPIAQEPVVVTKLPLPTGRTPDLGLGAHYSNIGSFSFPNGTQPGSAAFTSTPVIDPNLGPTGAPGVGSWTNIHAAGTSYSSTAVPSIAAVFQDPNGVDYLVLSAFDEQTQPNGVVLGTVVHVIVLPSDFVVGGTVQLDGTDRLVIFAHGDINQPSPQVAAAAISGTVTFTSGGTNIGDVITASVQGDFGDIQWNTPPPPPPPPPGNGIATGNYTFNVQAPSNVFCDGTLAGQEPAFSGVTATSLGFVNGTVTIAAGAPGSYAISGSPIVSAFQSSSLTLDPMVDAPPDVVGGMVNGSGSGPAQTMLMGAFLVLDGTSASATSLPGFAGVGYMNAAQDGFCQVDFYVDLTP